VKIAEVLDEKVTPEVGDPGRKLTLSMRALLTSHAISGEALREAVRPILDAELPENHAPVADTILFTQISSAKLDEHAIAQWTMRAERNIAAVLSPHDIIEQIKGSTARQAIERLSSTLPLAKPAQIYISPSWWPRLPLVPMRIQVAQSVSR
jgi:hypothetical protein